MRPMFLDQRYFLVAKIYPELEKCRFLLCALDATAALFPTSECKVNCSGGRILVTHSLYLMACNN